MGTLAGAAGLCLAAPLCTPTGARLGQALAAAPTPEGPLSGPVAATVVFLLLVIAPTFLFLGAAAGVVLGFVGARRQEARVKRRRSFAWCTLALALVVGGTALLPAATWRAGLTRRAWLAHAAGRGGVVIAAVEAYRAKYGRPPASLGVLVPEFLPDGVPGTGMLAYAEFDYQVADGRRPTRSWELSVGTPRGFANFDRLLYWPERRYPREVYGGRVSPIGDWAYVHE